MMAKRPAAGYKRVGRTRTVFRPAKAARLLAVGTKCPAADGRDRPWAEREQTRMNHASGGGIWKAVLWSVVVLHAALLVFLAAHMPEPSWLWILASGILLLCGAGLALRWGWLCLTPLLAFFLAVFWVKPLGYDHGLVGKSWGEWAWSAGATLVGLIVGVVLELRGRTKK